LPYVTTCIRFVLVVASFVSALFSDTSSRQRASSPNQPDDGTCAKPCPKLTASFLSVVFFWWFTR